MSVSILIGPRVSTSQKDAVFELKGLYIFNALPDKDNTDDSGVDKINILL